MHHSHLADCYFSYLLLHPSRCARVSSALFVLNLSTVELVELPLRCFQLTRCPILISFVIELIELNLRKVERGRERETEEKFEKEGERKASRQHHIEITWWNWRRRRKRRKINAVHSGLIVECSKVHYFESIQNLVCFDKKVWIEIIPFRKCTTWIVDLTNKQFIHSNVLNSPPWIFNRDRSNFLFG